MLIPWIELPSQGLANINMCFRLVDPSLPTNSPFIKITMWRNRRVLLTSQGQGNFRGSWQRTTIKATFSLPTNDGQQAAADYNFQLMDNTNNFIELNRPSLMLIPWVEWQAQGPADIDTCFRLVDSSWPTNNPIVKITLCRNHQVQLTIQGPADKRQIMQPEGSWLGTTIKATLSLNGQQTEESDYYFQLMDNTDSFIELLSKPSLMLLPWVECPLPGPTIESKARRRSASWFSDDE